MAHKYDLTTVPSQCSGPKRHFPWYKERLKWKYIQPRQQSNILRATQWRFVRNDTDDFRTGIPGVSKENIVYKREVGLVPVVDPAASKLRVTRRRGSIHSIKPHHIGATTVLTLNSKIGPRQQERMRRLAEAEQSLQEHPLALYPHLEEALPPELVDYIFDVLDPEISMSVQSSDHDMSGSASLTSVPEEDQSQHKRVEFNEQDTEETVKDDENIILSPSSTLSASAKVNIYRWPLTKTAEEEAMEQRLLAAQRAVSPTQESKVNEVTHNLVQWAKDMGGDGQSYIDEATIKKLFATDEAKPTLTVPIHVMDHSSVPTELMVTSSHCSSRSHSFHRDPRLHSIPLDTHQPAHVRTRYGAWYLHPKLWKPLPHNEPLKNPKGEADEKELEARRKSIALDAALAETHGARAFQDFIAARPGAVIPRFLKNAHFRTRHSQLNLPSKQST